MFRVINNFAHTRSLKLIGTDITRLIAYEFYWRSILTMALSCIISEIKRYIDWKSRFFHTPVFDAPIRRFKYCHKLWCGKLEWWKKFDNIASTQYTNVTDRRTDRQTDTAQQHRPLFYIASHGKKAIPMLFYIVSCNCRQTKLLCVLPAVNVYANHWVRSNCLHLAI